MKFLGKQYFVELYNCKTSKLDDSDFIGTTMVETANVANATVVQQFFHNFSPFGVSGTVVIAESHINIHTWPEYNYAAVDIFTCGDDLKPEKAVKYLAKALESTKYKLQAIDRGNLEEIQDESTVKYSDLVRNNSK